MAFMTQRQWSRKAVVLFAFLLVVIVHAQPGLPSFCFVLAKDRAAPRPLESPVRVMQHYRERVPYVGYMGSWLKQTEIHTLVGAPFVRDSTERWTVYYPQESMVESVLYILAGADTMRIELQEDHEWIWLRAMQGSGFRDSPEVIRFRKGRFVMDSLVVEPWAVQKAGILHKRERKAERADHISVMAMENKERKAQARLREAAEAEVLEREQYEARLNRVHGSNCARSYREFKGRLGLKKAELVSVTIDSVRVLITGHVLLDGGCSGSTPIWALEMRTDSGWVERIPFNREQMDCGMPWAEWKDHAVMIPVGWWVKVNSHEGQGELAPGTYRLFFLGRDTKRMHTDAFEVGP